jgi:hypothetical protein
MAKVWVRVKEGASEAYLASQDNIYDSSSYRQRIADGLKLMEGHKFLVEPEYKDTDLIAYIASPNFKLLPQDVEPC